VTPPTLAGGSTATLNLTIANQANPQSLGSANVTAPAGFTVTGVSPLPTGSSFSGTLIKLRNLNIAPLTSATFTITVSTPCQPPADPAWAVSAKQSNSYNGPPGNDLTLVPPSSLTATVSGSCRLVIVTQPADAQVGRAIRSVDYDPAAPPVKVEVHDGSDVLIPTATGTVTLTPSSNPAAFTGASASLSGGSATFPSLESSAAGIYTVTASGTGFASSDPSGPFEIGSKLVFLTQPQDAEAGATITTADFGTVPPAGYVQVAVVPPSDTAPYDPITTAIGSATLTASSNPGSFTGTNASFSSGIATFSTLESSATGTYTVTASSTGSTSATSDSFVISDFGTICPEGETLCEGSAQSADHKTSASVKATEADGFDADTTLAVSMLAGSTIPGGVCPGFSPLGSGVEVDVRPVPGMTEVTLTIDKSLVNTIPENGASHFQICFGGKIPTEVPPTTSFPTRDGTLAVFDPGTGLFWGLLPDCPRTPVTPCVLSRNKTKAGDFTGVYAVPDPWDQRGFTG
jgi:hypothetical protein